MMNDWMADCYRFITQQNFLYCQRNKPEIEQSIVDPGWDIYVTGWLDRYLPLIAIE